MKFSFWILLVTSFFFAPFASSQIVNVENQRIITDTTGWSGTAGVSLSATKFRKSFFAFSMNGHLQHKKEKDLWLAVIEYDVISAGGESFTNSGFGHIRYNRIYSEVVRLEAYSQLQYNSLTKIDVRYLNGLGFRLKLSPYERAKFYFGLSYMFEHERVADPLITSNDHRASSYFTFTLTPEETVTLSSTTYAQPKIGTIKDYRISNDTRLTFSVTEKLRFNFSLNFLYDSKPPVEIPSVNYQIKNGLAYNF